MISHSRRIPLIPNFSFPYLVQKRSSTYLNPDYKKIVVSAGWLRLNVVRQVFSRKNVTGDESFRSERARILWQHYTRRACLRDEICCWLPNVTFPALMPGSLRVAVEIGAPEIFSSQFHEDDSTAAEVESS